jgi:hypothetical protein
MVDSGPVVQEGLVATPPFATASAGFLRTTAAPTPQSSGAPGLCGLRQQDFRPRAAEFTGCGCGPHRDAGQMRWVILDLGELPCLIDVSKLNPGPSGDDADAVGQPRDVGSSCSAPVRAGTGRHRAFI